MADHMRMTSLYFFWRVISHLSVAPISKLSLPIRRYLITIFMRRSASDLTDILHHLIRCVGSSLLIVSERFGLSLKVKMLTRVRIRIPYPDKWKYFRDLDISTLQLSSVIEITKCEPLPDGTLPKKKFDGLFRSRAMLRTRLPASKPNAQLCWPRLKWRKSDSRGLAKC